LRLESPFAAGHAESISRCGIALIERDLSEPQRLASIRIRSNVPIHYSNWQRVVGLYPVSQLFLRRGINSLHQELTAEFALPLDELPVRGQLQRYKPAAAPDLHASQVAEILRHARRTPLAIPEPESAQLANLLRHYAPIWEFDQVTDDDRIGRVRYDSDRQAHFVDISTPVAYQWASHTLFNGQPLLQLNYLVWVPARTAVSTTDIYAGKFDGLIWRVTLLPDGTPLAYDSVHPCGCYYLLFTGAKATPRATSNVAEPILAAQNLPVPEPAQRMVIRVRAGDHYIQRVYPDGDAPGIVYQSADYQSLLAITDASGQAHRFFDEQGLLPASARPERYLFWPFGIASAGAMRRSGTHAIAFVGVRHFDDAHLLEELLELDARPLGLSRRGEPRTYKRCCPTQSAANCRATRPLRDPRCKAQRNASSCAASSNTSWASRRCSQWPAIAR
jgi:hypothetical protein